MQGCLEEKGSVDGRGGSCGEGLDVEVDSRHLCEGAGVDLIDDLLILHRY